MNYTLESFINFCDDMMIVTEAKIDIKTRIRQLMTMFKNFFITIFKKIKEWFRVTFKHDVYIYKSYYENLNKYLNLSVIEYKNYVDQAKKDLKDVSEYIKSDEFKEEYDTSEWRTSRMANYVYRKNTRPIYNLKNSSFFDRGHKAKIDELINIVNELKNKEKSKDERKNLKIDKEIAMSNFELITQNEINKLIQTMDSFRKLGEEFDKYATSLDISEDDYNILPYYNEISKYGTHFTKLFTSALMENIYNPKIKDTETNESYTSLYDDMQIAEESLSNDESYASIRLKLFDSTKFKNTKEYYNEKVNYPKKAEKKLIQF